MRKSFLFLPMALALLSALSFSLAAAQEQPLTSEAAPLAVKAVPVVQTAVQSPAAPGSQALDPAGIQRLKSATGDAARISIHPATGAARFVSLPAGSLTLKVTKDASAAEKAAAFFAAHGSIFGIRNAAAELKLVETKTDAFGTTHLGYQQVYQGVPVFAGIMRVHFDAAGQLAAVNGTFIPQLSLSATPFLSAQTVAEKAVAAVVAQPYSADHQDDAGHSEKEFTASDLTVANNDLVIYREGLAQGIRGSNHLVYQVEVTSGSTLREFLYISAHSGKIVDRMSAIHDALNRILYEQSPTSNPIWEEGDPFPGTLNQDQQNILIASEDSYNFFSSLTNGTYLSYDGQDAPMRSVNNDPTIDCPNANWNGQTTNYCNGVTADDIVAHEWGHAYTEYNHNLIYQWQPGALNESYSDIFGETIDLLNGFGTDSPSTNRSACTPTDASIKWLMGEDSTAFGGAIRDMWNPTCMGDPDKVSAPQYHCAASDGGGVHSNSAVPNHAYALLVDGGTFNGQTIAAIGMTRAAHIYWRAMDIYQVPDTDFPEHAASLRQSCQDLIGEPLFTLSTELTTTLPSADLITPNTCAELDKAIAAVELETPPTQCNFQPLLGQNPPPLCPGVERAPTSVFSDSFESGLSAWTLTNMGVYAGWTPHDWVQDTTLPLERPGAAAYANGQDVGSCDEGANDESGVIRMESPVITIPAGDVLRRVAFEHYIASEAQYDGGNIKISINAGAYTVVPNNAFIYNPHNLTMNAGGTSPLAGEPAFSGTNGGSVNGSWVTSIIDLDELGVQPGNTIRLRYDFGRDGCGGNDGWYVDDVQVYTCEQPDPAEISVDPSVLTSAQPTDTVVTKPFTITNIGEDDLTWNIVEVGPGAGKTQVGKHLPVRREASPAVSRPKNNRPAITPQAELIQDGSFEDGTPNAFWDEASTTFGTPICDPASCGADLSLTGSWYVWFGGVDEATEVGSVQQEVTIPTGEATLSFWLQIGDFGATGNMRVLIDGTPIFTVTEANANEYAVYNEVVLDVDNYADGASHTLRFESTTVSSVVDETVTFLIDDVSLDSTGGSGSCVANDIPWLSVAPTNGMASVLESDIVMVTFDSTGLMTGNTYTGTLCISSNDPNNAEVIVPVTLTLEAPPTIEINPTVISETLQTGEQLSTTITISNTGVGGLDWNILEEEGARPAQPIQPQSLLAAREVGTPRTGTVQADQPALRPANFIQDGSFEAGSPNPFWDEDSTNFGTPLCDDACPGPGGHTGEWYIWFGGSNNAEVGHMYQDGVVFPNGMATLSFWLAMGAGAGTGNMVVSIDGTNIFTVTHDDGDSFPAYTLVTLDVSAFADGGAHDVHFDSATTGGILNIFVDDVSLVAGGPPCQPTDVPWLGVSPMNGYTPSGGSSEVALDIDASNLASGQHTAALCIQSDDPNNPTTRVDITINVEPAPLLPEIEVSPEMITATLVSGETSTDTFEVRNTGGTPLIWELAEALPWASATPISGTTFPSFSDPVTVTFDATGLAAGVYTGTMSITSNDLDEPITAVTVTLWVLAGEVEVPTEPISETLLVGGVATHTVTISNTGDAPIEFTITEMMTAGLKISRVGQTPATDTLPWVTVTPTHGVISPSGAADIWITLDAAGLTPGVYTGTLQIETTDPVTPTYWIPLTLNVEVISCYDYNESGIIDIGDIQQLAAAFSGSYDPAYDLVAPYGEIDVFDIIAIAEAWENTCQ